MKKLYAARDHTEAHLLKGVLEGEQIEVEVHGESLWALRGELPFGEDTAPSVWIVNDDDYDRAMELISVFHDGEAQTPIEGKPWRCRCGEENEDRFTECWNCGKAKPSFGKGKS